jgi:hypothetical protein
MHTSLPVSDLENCKYLIFFAQGIQALTIMPESNEQLYMIFTAKQQYD